MEKIIIIGAGVVGLATALALAQSEREIVVLDRRRPSESIQTDFDQRVYALTRHSERFLTSLGVWSGCQRVTPYQRMLVWDDAQIQFNCRDMGESNLGHIVEHQVLMAALMSRLADFETIHFQQINHCQNISQTDVVTLVADEREFQADGLIAADGAQSWVRNFLNIPLVQWPYHQQAIVATVQLSVPHQFTAWQRFLPTGPLALLPLPDPHWVSIVWSCDTPLADELLNVDDTTFSDRLTQNIVNKLGVVESVGPRLSFPLKMQHAKRYTQQRIALLGDAVHTIHPLAGQGLNLGLADAKCLTDLIKPGFSPRQCRRYARIRQAENWKMIAVMEGFKQLFSGQNPWLHAGRNAGLANCDRIAWLKQFFIQQAQGIT